MGFLWHSYGGFHDVSMIFLWVYYGMSEGILWDSYYEISLLFLCYFHVTSMVFLWDFCGVPMGFPGYFYDISVGFL